MPRLPGVARFARMAGSSIAAPGAAAWVTDFLNAAYYARRDDERDVADLRLAHGILTTRWAQRGSGRMGAVDVLALHRAYGAARHQRDGRLDRDALLEGAAALIGDWFPAAWDDDARRAHGIAFPSEAERTRFLPERRQERAALKAVTPPRRSPAEQHWATYDPVALPDTAGALRLLAEPARWPDMGCASGRFTALRSGGPLGQTFEIEVVADPTPRSPVFTRGYVTCTAFHVAGGEPDSAAALEVAVASLTQRYRAGAGGDATSLIPAGGEAVALVVLTTHDGHFLGRALSHLLVWRDADGRTWIRDVGAWDPLPLHLAATYAAAGRVAQHQFWGPEPVERSMLAQLALVTAVAA